MIALPEPAEAQALADALRDMMAADRLDHGVLRRAANALQAFAEGRPIHGFVDESDTVWAGVCDVTGDPMNGILSSFEGGEHGDADAINRCQ